MRLASDTVNYAVVASILWSNLWIYSDVKFSYAKFEHGHPVLEALKRWKFLLWVVRITNSVPLRRRVGYLEIFA